MKISTLLIATILFCNSVSAQQSISLIFPASLTDTSITTLAINDVQHLLHEACNCEVSLNNTNADVLLKLPKIKKAIPEKFIGSTTQQSILSGVMYGTAKEIDAHLPPK